MTKCSKELDQEIHKDIGLLINALRISANMKIAKLAQELGISESRLQRYMYRKRERCIPLIVIKECAKIFGVSFSYFFKD
jgi:transcriptional regulator with XRE-family HTH domain